MFSRQPAAYFNVNQTKKKEEEKNLKHNQGLSQKKYWPQNIPLYVRLYLTPGLILKSVKSQIFLVSAQGDAHVHGLSEMWYLE